MAKWFLRDRGQVLGPYTTEEILAMRAQGTVASYHEVSLDRRAWKLVDDVPELSPPDPRRARPPARPRPAAAATRPADSDDEAAYAPPAPRSSGTRRQYLLVVGGVLGLVVIGGLVLVAILVFRARTKETANTGPPPVAEGPITFTQQTGTRDRDQVLDGAVGLIVAGLNVRSRDGVMSEVPTSTGTGFVISPTGHIVTNRHVVQKTVSYSGSVDQADDERALRSRPEPKIWVFFGHDNKFEVDLGSVYVSPDYDFAILRITRPATRYFALSKTNDADTPRFDQVFSLGFPATDRKAQDVMNPKDRKEAFIPGAPVQRYFRTADFQHTKERGGIRKSAFLARPDVKYLEAYVLTHDARIAHGNSGGPLITSDGTVVGINTSGIFTNMGGVVALQEGQSYAQTLPQFRKEIDRRAPGVVWREPSDGR